MKNVSILAPDKVCENNTEPCGLGVVGDLPEPLPAEKFLDLLKNVFHLRGLKGSEILHPEISKVALCGGSGSSLIPDALRSGAQVFVSADFSYHTYFETIPHMMLIDAGHSLGAEAGIQDEVCRVLRKNFLPLRPQKRINTNPFDFIKYHTIMTKKTTSRQDDVGSFTALQNAEQDGTLTMEDTLRFLSASTNRFSIDKKTSVTR